MELFILLLILLSICVNAYLIGSIPTSYLIGKLFFKTDIRNKGSKNPGGTNAGRVFGFKIGIIVIILDVLKVLLPFIFTFILTTKYTPLLTFLLKIDEIYHINNDFSMLKLSYWIAPLFGVIGHSFSIFLKFKGGKAVSSFIGFSSGASYLGTPGLFIIFCITLLITKIVSISSITMCFIYTLFSWVLYILSFFNKTLVDNLMYFGKGPDISIYFPLFLTVSFIILFIRHKENIIRIKNKNEPKVSFLK